MSLFAIAAAILFSHTSTGQTVDLHNKRAHCGPALLLASYTSPNQVVTKGCWQIQEGRVVIHWDDGDIGVMSPQSFTKVGPYL
jgi:hypothetical protein